MHKPSIAIISRDDVLIRWEPPPRRTEFSEATGFVCDRLAEGWTPEQIAGWLKAGHERGLRALGFEAIYRAARKGEELWRYLTRHHKRRRPRRARPSRDTIKDRSSNHDRPENIEERADIGHW